MRQSIGVAIVADGTNEALVTTLNSIAGFADEIVIVGGDQITGGKIRHYEIDSEIGSRNARTFAFKKVRSDWVLWLETGETVLPTEWEKICELSTMKNANIFFLRLIEASGFMANCPRFFRTHLKLKFDKSEKLRLDTSEITKARAKGTCYLTSTFINAPTKKRETLGAYGGTIKDFINSLNTTSLQEVDVSWTICNLLSNMQPELFFSAESELLINIAWERYHNRPNVLLAISHLEEKRGCLWYSFHAIKQLVTSIESSEADEDPDFDIRRLEQNAYERLSRLANKIGKNDTEFIALSKLNQLTGDTEQSHERYKELLEKVIK